MPVISALRHLRRISATLLVLGIMGAAETTSRIAQESVVVTVDPAVGSMTLSVPQAAVPFARGRLRGTVASTGVGSVEEPGLGRGQAITVRYADGGRDELMVFPGVPFALIRPVFANGTASPVVANRIPVLGLDLELGHPPQELTTLGTTGLNAPTKAVNSYAFLAVAHPATRDGVVAGWLSHERASGVLTCLPRDGGLHLDGNSDYGRLRLPAGGTARGELLAVGRFADVRLGLEAWAGAVARSLAIRLPPPPVVYCTWYANAGHGGAGDEKSTAELAAFAGRELGPYGLTGVQIDDGWQEGEKINGPKKNFSAYSPQGPYPGGMRPTAAGIAAAGLTPGLWILPFGGTWNDPFFADHQDWFVKTPEGKPFETKWAGTALDMTHPGAREFVAGEIRQAVRDWGFRYLKLDGLFVGMGIKLAETVKNPFQDDGLGDAVFSDPSQTNIEVFRNGLRLIRDAAGPDTFFLGCCAPQNMRSFAGVFGLVQGMRSGIDNGGTWKEWLRASPPYGSRFHHLNGRIWWNDPDPIYVRSGIPLESARCIASWNAITGQMLSLSDWLPKLPEERLDILRRVMPAHGVTARCADLLEAKVPRIWTATDDRPGRQRRDVVGLFNWDDAPVDLAPTAAELGLPPAPAYIAYDFWNKQVVRDFPGKIAIPGTACRVLAVRPLLDRPFLLSTSRHVSQGIVEVSRESWDADTGTLQGVSRLVPGDDYELRVIAPGTWTVQGVEISPADRKDGVTARVAGTETDLVRIALRASTARDVAWSVRLRQGR